MPSQRAPSPSPPPFISPPSKTAPEETTITIKQTTKNRLDMFRRIKAHDPKGTPVLEAWDSFMRRILKGQRLFVEHDPNSLAAELGYRWVNENLDLCSQIVAQNLPVVKMGRDLESIPKQPSPGIVIAAGPSLERYGHLDLIRKLQFKGIIVVVDRILEKVLEAGIIPDYVISLDSSPQILDFFSPAIVRSSMKDLKGVFSITTHPSVIGNWEGQQTFFYCPLIPDWLAPNVLHTWLVMLGKDSGPGKPNPFILNTMAGNVGSAGWMLAVRLGCNPIALTGFDFGWYKDDQPPETTEQWHRYVGSEGVEGAKKFFHDTVHPFFKTPCYYDDIFKAYMESFLPLIKAVKVQEGYATYNATGGGCLAGDGLEYAYLDDWIKKYGLAHAPNVEIDFSWLSPTDITHQLHFLGRENRFIDSLYRNAGFEGLPQHPQKLPSTDKVLVVGNGPSAWTEEGQELIRDFRGAVLATDASLKRMAPIRLPWYVVVMEWYENFQKMMCEGVDTSNVWLISSSLAHHEVQEQPWRERPDLPQIRQKEVERKEKYGEEFPRGLNIYWFNPEMPNTQMKMRMSGLNPSYPWLDGAGQVGGASIALATEYMKTKEVHLLGIELKAQSDYGRYLSAQLRYLERHSTEVKYVQHSKDSHLRGPFMVEGFK